MRKPLPLFVALLLLASLAGAARADLAVLADGRVLRVRAVRPLGESAWLLELAGGGEVSCPRSRLVEVRPDRARPAAVPDVRQLQPWQEAAGRFEEAIGRFAREHALEPELVVAVITAESNFDPFALSPKGAQGLMQLMPQTAAELDVGDPYDPEQNIRGGVSYLKGLLSRFGGDLELALAAYNAGPEAVDRHGGIPPYPETREYVRRVLREYNRL